MEKKLIVAVITRMVKKLIDIYSYIEQNHKMKLVFWFPIPIPGANTLLIHLLMVIIMRKRQALVREKKNILTADKCLKEMSTQNQHRQAIVYKIVNINKSFFLFRR